MREGRDVTVVSLALMVHQTLKACEQLAGEGISVELIDPRTVAPLDLDTIRQSVAKTGRLLIVDEAFAPFGLGAEIAASLADRGLRRSRRPDSPAERRLRPHSLQPAARSGRRAQPRHHRPGHSRPDGRIGEDRSHGERRSPFPGSDGTWTKASSSAGSRPTAQPIKAGEPLFNLEGDKATQEIESLEAGILRIPPDGPKDGEKVAVGRRHRLPGRARRAGPV